MAHAVMPKTRKTDYPVEPLFVERWSPRAMSGDLVSREELMPLFEAARWAPSSYNNQPWRFFYAVRNGPDWESFYGLLEDFNKTWCRNAGALVIVASKKKFDRDGQPSRTHSFDAGAAWAQFALQGSVAGLVVHGMEGFDYERAKMMLGLNGDYEVEAMAAVGHPGRKEDLPAELRERERPSPRKRLSETVFEGAFRKG